MGFYRYYFSAHARKRQTDSESNVEEEQEKANILKSIIYVLYFSSARFLWRFQKPIEQQETKKTIHVNN